MSKWLCYGVPRYTVQRQQDKKRKYKWRRFITVASYHQTAILCCLDSALHSSLSCRLSIFYLSCLPAFVYPASFLSTLPIIRLIFCQLSCLPAWKLSSRTRELFVYLLQPPCICPGVYENGVDIPPTINIWLWYNFNILALTPLIRPRYTRHRVQDTASIHSFLSPRSRCGLDTLISRVQEAVSIHSSCWRGLGCRSVRPIAERGKTPTDNTTGRDKGRFIRVRSPGLESLRKECVFIAIFLSRGVYRKEQKKLSRVRKACDPAWARGKNSFRRGLTSSTWLGRNGYSATLPRYSTE